MKKQSFLAILALVLLTACTKESLQSDDLYPEYRSKKVEHNAKHQFRPIKGKLVITTVSRVVEIGITRNVYEGEGILNHLGKVSVVSTQNIPPSGIFYGTIIITAANGDRLDMDMTGQLTSLDPLTGDFTSETDFSIRGGTGRFDDAAGSGKAHGSGTFPQFPPVDPVTVNLEITGEIVY